MRHRYVQAAVTPAERKACQATIRFTRRRQLEMPMAKPHDLDLVTG